MSQKYSHLFFDLDHTLWDTDRNAEESLSEIFEELNLSQKGVPDFDTFHVQYKQHNERLWGLYSDNKVGKDAVRLHRFVHTLQDFDIHDDAIANSLADAFVMRTPHKQYLYRFDIIKVNLWNKLITYFNESQVYRVLIFSML